MKIKINRMALGCCLCIGSIVVGATIAKSIDTRSKPPAGTKVQPGVQTGVKVQPGVQTGVKVQPGVKAQTSSQPSQSAGENPVIIPCGDPELEECTDRAASELALKFRISSKPWSLRVRIPSGMNDEARYSLLKRIELSAVAKVVIRLKNRAQGLARLEALVDKYGRKARAEAVDGGNWSTDPNDPKVVIFAPGEADDLLPDIYNAMDEAGV